MRRPTNELDQKRRDCHARMTSPFSACFTVALVHVRHAVCCPITTSSQPNRTTSHRNCQTLYLNPIPLQPAFKPESRQRHQVSTSPPLLRSLPERFISKPTRIHTAPRKTFRLSRGLEISHVHAPNNKKVPSVYAYPLCQEAPNPFRCSS